MMRVAALFSGGKDSAFSVYIAQQYGWDVSYLVTLQSEQQDSWMYHAINIHLTELLAEAIGIPLKTKHTKGEKETELADLKTLLENLDVDGVISGAIASEYQRTRIDRVCDSLGLKSFTPLWHKNQALLVRDQISAGFIIMIVGVSAEGFDETWLGRTLDTETLADLTHLHQNYRINIAGEGGEFETLVLNGPIFQKKLVLDQVVTQWNRDSGALYVNAAHLEPYNVR